MKKNIYPFIKNSYGEFSEDGSEYIVKNPAPPRPWINYLSNGRYCSIISQTAGGFSYYLDPSENRVTRWSPENYLTNRPGFYLYVKDQDSGEICSATYSPVSSLSDVSPFEKGGQRGILGIQVDSSAKPNLKFISAVHGLGYTVITTENKGLIFELTYFTPLDDDLTCCIVRIKNGSGKKKNFKLFPFVEWLFGNYFMELQIRNISVLYNEGWFDKKTQTIMAHKFPVGNNAKPYVSFMSSGLPVKGFDIDYEVFLGRYGEYSKPEAVSRGSCFNSEVRGKNMVGVLECDMKLSPGEEKEFSFFWGIGESHNENVGEALAASRMVREGTSPSPTKGKLRLCESIKKYKSVKHCKRELVRVKDYWKKLIPGNVTVKSEDVGLDLMMNTWLKYQILMNNHWGRSATFYHEGGGEFGYRNTTQDAWSIVPIDAAYAKERLIMITKCQRKSGQPLPGWSLEKGFSTHTPPADFPVWFPLLLSTYVKETGDAAILKREEKYFDGGKDSVYEHAVNGLRFLQDRASGQHKIPLMGTQDWNDAFDRCGIGGKGESVWLGIGLCYALKNMIELSDFIGDKKTSEECKDRYDTMKRIINKVGWDGDWYLYAFDDNGKPVGSHKNIQGKIQLNAQTWAIIAGIADEEKIKRIYKSIDKYLDTKYGLLLFAPEYSDFHPNLGRISAFAPGTKENAAIFMHGCAFKMYADLILGRADEAYATLKKVMPFDIDPEKQKSEPYILPEYRIGAGNKDMGEGAFSWLTGSADWFFMSILNLMFGVMPDFGGLRIQPQLPSHLGKVNVVRKYRGATYDIAIENRGGAKPIKISVDGNPHGSGLLPLFNDNKTHKIEVII